jgi:hypothetical protein
MTSSRATQLRSIYNERPFTVVPEKLAEMSACLFQDHEVDFTRKYHHEKRRGTLIIISLMTRPGPS